MITKYIILFLVTFPFTATCMTTQYDKRVNKLYKSFKNNKSLKIKHKLGTISNLVPDVQNKIISTLFATYDTNQNGVDEKTLELFKKTNLNTALQHLKKAAHHQKSLPMFSLSQLFRMTRKQIAVCKTTYNRTDYAVRPGNIISETEAATIRTLQEDNKQAFILAFVKKQGPFHIHKSLTKTIKVIPKTLREIQPYPEDVTLCKTMVTFFCFNFGINYLTNTILFDSLSISIVVGSLIFIMTSHYFFPVFNKKRTIPIDI